MTFSIACMNRGKDAIKLPSFNLQDMDFIVIRFVWRKKNWQNRSRDALDHIHLQFEH